MAGLWVKERQQGQRYVWKCIWLGEEEDSNGGRNVTGPRVVMSLVCGHVSSGRGNPRHTEKTQVKTTREKAATISTKGPDEATLPLSEARLCHYSHVTPSNHSALQQGLETAGETDCNWIRTAAIVDYLAVTASDSWHSST